MEEPLRFDGRRSSPPKQYEMVRDTSLDSETTTMAAPTTVSATQAAQVAPETVTTGDVTTAQTPQEIQAAQMTATTVAPDAQVQAAEGQVSEDAIA